MITLAQKFLTLLKVFVKNAYHLIPIKFRYRCSTLVWKFFDQLKRIFNPICPQIFIFKGLEKNSQLPLSFAYAGLPSGTQEYLARTILTSGFQKHALGRHLWSSVTSLLKENYPDCGFFFTECNPLTLAHFSRKPGFYIPRWVNMEMDISMPVEKLLGSERPEILRKIRRNRLAYEMTREKIHLDDFYHHMYLPYIQTRYGNMAMISSHQRLLEILSKGELILIKKDDAFIAGGLLEFREGKVSFRMLGIRGGDLEYVRLGVIGALYYFIAVEMKKKGCQKIYIGGTRPLLSDGVTRFKKSLKARLISHDRNDRLWLKLLKDSPGLRDCLINNPFIFYTKDGKPHRAVFMEAQENGSQQGLKEALRVSACGGVEETNLFIFCKIKNPADYARLLQGPSLSVRSAKELFPD